MSFPVSFVLAVTGLIVSAKTRLNLVLFGWPVSVPYLGIIAALIVLALAAAVLYLVRSILRDRPQPGSRPVYVVTDLR